MIVFYVSLLLATAQPTAVLPTHTTPAVLRTKEAVKVYPTPRNEGSITVQSANQASLDFYLFDVDGTLIYQTQLKKNEKLLVEGLHKGTYVYNAFQNDEKVEGGKIELR